MKVSRFLVWRGWLGAVVFLAIALLSAAPAHAGDTASLNVLGFSDDGKVFAFEEFGVLDGPGDAYSDIFFIDTEKDRFLAGTPIRVRIDKQQSLAKIRSISHAKAAPLIARYRLDEDPGVMVAYNPISEVGSNPHKLRYYEFLSSPPRSQTSTLELTETEFPPVNDCLNMAGNYTGFVLKLTEYGGNPVDKVLHTDGQIPKSRNCPNGYRLGAVISSETSGRQIAMIVVSSFGFEGNDERWIAVPVDPSGL
jgi:predicted secreted protein